ncbi:MAG: Lrp/AsnC family transcriptional regulator [Boseongicola sp.]|nr:Lrp/AsnC family transcriptional regulator [Boseongicola sp.]
MDEIDEELIELLVENARQPVASLAQHMDLARSTVQARLDRLERKGVITGYTVRLGDIMRSERLRATVLLQIDPMKLAPVLSKLKALPEVRAAHTASGRFDLIVTLSAQTTEVLDAALDAIGTVNGVRTSESLIHLSTRIDRRAF